MKTGKEQLLNNTYEKFLDLVLGDFSLERIDEIAVQDVMGYGTTIDEKLFEIEGLQELVIRQRKQSQGAEIDIKTDRVFQKIFSNYEAALIVDEFQINMIIDGMTNFIPLRVSTVLEFVDNDWKVIHWHGSVAVESEDDTWHINEWKQKNEKLQRLVDEQTADLVNKNRELEIEAALERVRAVALSMKKAEDMIVVCRIISEQLDMLGVREIRNVQTAIINEEKSTYLNYQYFPLYHKSVVEETDYKRNPHPKVLEMVNEMKKSVDSFFVGSMSGESLQSFREYRKRDNQFPDPKLDETESVHYCFYSIGEGGLGLTTYKPLTTEALNIFKRFHNVFSLAYQRFIDIEKAMVQAREAQIEAALEKIRNRTLLMKDSSELNEAVGVFFQQFKGLDLLPAEARTYFSHVNTDKDSVEVWMTHTDGSVMSGSHITPMTKSPLLKKYYKEWKKNKEFVNTRIYAGQSLKDYMKFLSTLPHVAGDKDYQKLFESPPNQIVMTDAGFLQGFLGIMSYEPLKPEAIEILKRFSKVFEFTYTRFLDLQKAEAQAREAQIEAALERVRARSMAMHESQELREIIACVFEELQKLDFVAPACSLIFYQDDKSAEHWFAGFTEGAYPQSYTIPYIDIPYYTDLLKAWHEGSEYEEFIMEGQAKVDYAKWLLSETDFKNLPEEFVAGSGMQTPLPLYFSDAYNKYGMLEIIGNESLPMDKVNIVKRMSKVFEQTYTRFLDLKKAEAQAREAEIQLALEKVRMVALSLKKSEEMLQVAKALYEELVKLGFSNIRNAIIDISNGDDDTFTDYDYSDEMSGTITQMSYHDDPTLEGQFKKMATTTNDFFELVLEGKELEDLIAMRRKNGEAEDPRLLNTDIVTYNLYSFGNGAIGISNFGVLSEEEKIILNRFSNVFTFAYKRYNDLATAEAQAREAQIEAALERVRARTMAMQKSNELAQTAANLFEQMETLGIKPYRCNIAIVDDKNKKIKLWSTTNSGKVIPVGNNIPFNENSVFKEVYKGWKKQRTYHTIKLIGEDRVTWAKFISKYVPFEEYKPENFNKSKLMNEAAFFNNFYFRQGFFVIHTKEEMSDEDYDIVQRFANVFEQTYTRFRDLENAEYQNKIIQAENDRKTKELEEARELQLSILPKVLPELPNLSLAAYMQTATEVGGDYYDFHVAEDGTLTAVIGDATGHGMKAGTMVTITKSLFDTFAANDNIIETFDRTSKVIKGLKFRQVSMCLLMLKLKGNKLKISSAAMPPALIYRKKNQAIEEIFMKGMPLGAMNNFPYKLQETKIEKGDTILLMSDGLPELSNGNGKMYGYERTKSEFHTVGEKDPEEIVTHLKNSASKWVNGNAPDDDITFVVIRVK